MDDKKLLLETVARLRVDWLKAKRQFLESGSAVTVPYNFHHGLCAYLDSLNVIENNDEDALNNICMLIMDICGPNSWYKGDHGISTFRTEEENTLSFILRLELLDKVKEVILN